MREKMLWMLLPALLLALLAGCGAERGGADIGGPDSGGAGGDSAVTAAASSNLKVLYAQYFDIQYLADGVKLLTDSAGRELLLVPNGTAVPTGYESAVKVSTPVRRAMFTSTVYISFLEALEEPALYDSIAALTMQAGNQEILDRFDSGQIAYIDPETWIAGDMEAVTAANPDLVFLDASREEEAALAALLDQAGIPYVAAAQWPEGSTEAHLEWLKFFGAFYNLDQRANGLWEDTLSRLSGLYAQLASIPDRERPVVAVGRISGGTVYTHAGGSAIAQQVERAGAVYALAELEGSGAVQMDLEEFLDACKDADVLLYDALPQDMTGTLLEEEPLFAECKAYQNGRVFTLDSSYSMKTAQVVEQFEDLTAICHPEREADHAFTIYQPLAELDG